MLCGNFRPKARPLLAVVSKAKQSKAKVVCPGAKILNSFKDTQKTSRYKS